MNGLMSVWDGLINWLAYGLADMAWWQIVLFTVVTTHVTIASVTIFLHRAQAHRALDLGPVPSHFFRLWLWLTTGMVTKEWAAIHRGELESNWKKMKAGDTLERIAPWSEDRHEFSTVCDQC